MPLESSKGFRPFFWVYTNPTHERGALAEDS